MKRKFRVTIWIHDVPFSAFGTTMQDALNLIEKAAGNPLPDDQRRNVIDVMIAMLMADRDVESILTRYRDGSVKISLSYINPMNIASIVA